MRNVTEPELALQEVIFRLQSAYFNSCGIIGISSIASWRKVPHVRICTSTKWQVLSKYQNSCLHFTYQTYLDIFMTCILFQLFLGLDN